MYRETYAEINLRNFRNNLTLLKGFNSHSTFFCPMIKANAYGHGDIELAKVAVSEGVRSLGVALFEEAVRLRQAGLECEILVFYPAIDKASATLLHQYNLTPVVSSWSGLQELAKLNRQISLHVKFNTGMNRLGFSSSDAKTLSIFFHENEKLQLVGLCSHLAIADDMASTEGFTAQQIAKLLSIRSMFKQTDIVLHCLNSEGLIGRHCLERDELNSIGARPGISLYGIKPELKNLNSRSLDRWHAINLKPVMQIKSRIVQVQSIKKNEIVSYGGRYKVDKDSLIAVIPVGYADGYSRQFSNRASVLCAGKEVPVSGSVCMDYTMVDLTKHFAVRKNWLDEEVVLLGQQGEKTITAEELAKIAQTNSYEILTSISQRVPRVYV